MEVQCTEVTDSMAMDSERGLCVDASLSIETTNEVMIHARRFTQQEP
jgi:hypothetical protein